MASTRRRQSRPRLPGLAGRLAAAGALFLAPCAAPASEAPPVAAWASSEAASVASRGLNEFPAAGRAVFARPAAGNPPLLILRIPDNFTYAGVRKLVSDWLDALPPASSRLKVYVGGHGRKSSAEDTLDDARRMAAAARADAIAVLDFPELRSWEEPRWAWAIRGAARKLAAAVAAVNDDPRSMAWAMRGESAMAEAIALMYEVAPPELKPSVRVEGNVVLDSYPWAVAPFLPRELSPGFLRQVGGRAYVNFTKFGHWSNPMRGGPRLVNVCVAPRGNPVSHGYYDVVEETRVLEELEISGAPIEAVLAWAERVGTCSYLSNLIDDLRRAELPGLTPPMVAPILRPN